MNKRCIKKTRDGSYTVYDPDREAAFHSYHGALAESRHIFIEKGLEYVMSRKEGVISVLEVGMGTGLNVLLSILKAEEKQRRVYYEALEPEPLSSGLIENLDYPAIFNLTNSQDYFHAVHSSEAGRVTEITSFFTFMPLRVPVKGYRGDRMFDVIYYDAFAPVHQPEMWEGELFKKVYNLLNEGGVLTTFCASGAFKRNLKSAGFRVEPLEGPPGKREMTRGIRPHHT